MSQSSRAGRAFSLLLAAALLLLTGCAGENSADKKKPVLTSGAPNVYIIRPPSTPVGRAIPIYVDGRLVGRLPNRSYTKFRLEPGVHLVEMRDAYVSGPYLKAKIEVTPGRTVHLANVHDLLGEDGPRIVPSGSSSYTFSAGGSVTKDRLAEITPALAQEGMAKFTYVPPSPAR